MGPFGEVPYMAGPGGPGPIGVCTWYGAWLALLCTACMNGSSLWLLVAGESPVRLLGEFQLLIVAGEVAGESSDFRLRLAELRWGGGGAPMGSAP